jgi:hypothetical protein
MDLVMSIGDGYGGKSIDEYRDRARDGLLSAPTPPLAHELVGRRCVKEFADHGVFEGIVESFDPGSPDGQGPLGTRMLCRSSRLRCSQSPSVYRTLYPSGP